MKKLKSVSNSENNKVDKPNTTTNVYTENAFTLGVKGSPKRIQKLIDEVDSCGCAHLIVFPTEERALMAAKKLRPAAKKQHL